MARAKRSKADPVDEIEKMGDVLKEIAGVLRPLDDAARARVLRAVAAYYDFEVR